MKKFLFIALFLFLYTGLNAATENYKIIVGTFLNEKDAKNGLKSLMDTLQSNHNMVELQSRYNFYFTARKSDSYHIVLMEPFSDKKLLNEVLQEVRKVYNGAFVNKASRKEFSLNENTLQLKTPRYEQLDVTDSEIAYEVKPKNVQENVKAVDKTPIVEEKITDDVVKTAKVPEEEQPVKAEKIKTDENNGFFDGFILILSVVTVVIISILIYIISHLRRRNQELKHMVQYMHSADNKSDYKLAEEKELFLAKVSHELRTPINAIIGLSNIVLQSKLNSAQHENIRKIKHSGEMVLAIVDDILDITKIDVGALKIESIEFNINEVLEHVSNMVSLKAEDKGLELIYNVDRSVPAMMIGDPLRLGQILINLLDNAIKFTQDGVVELNIKTIDDYYEGKVGLEFRVIDHGIGMSQKQIKDIYKDFTQADETVCRIYGGTGLGLSITKQLVDMMDGSIDINSQEGVGTEFLVKIYFTQYEVNNRRHYRLPSKSLMSKNAIIVDNNFRSVETLSNMLKYFHYKVEVVSSLGWAEDLLSQVSYDMIFIDENILLKNSIDQVKEIKQRYDLKVILIESIYYQNNNEIREIKEIDNHLLKPLNQNTIFNLILDIYGETNKLEEKTTVKREDLRIFKNIHIFVADDNKINQKILLGLLDGTGFILTMADNGKELLEKLENSTDVDLILMDINMNIMDGYEATKEIRKMSKFNDVPIYALTANSHQKHLDEAMACGMQGYLIKPLNVDSLYEKLFDLFREMNKHPDPSIKNNRKKSRSYMYRELDIDYGLENSDSNPVVYNALLNDFVNMYSDASGVIDCTIGERRYHDAQNFVHDLKTLASNLGGHRLSRSASKLEDAFADKRFNKNSILIDRLKRDIEMFLIDIDRYRKDSKK